MPTTRCTGFFVAIMVPNEMVVVCPSLDSRRHKFVCSAVTPVHLNSALHITHFLDILSLDNREDSRHFLNTGPALRVYQRLSSPQGHGR